MNCKLKSKQTINYSAFVSADSLSSISKRFKTISIRLKKIPYLLCIHFQTYNCVGSDQYSGICLLFFLCCSIVIDFRLFILRILKFKSHTFIKFSSSFTNLCVLAKSSGPKSFTNESYFKSLNCEITNLHCRYRSTKRDFYFKVFYHLKSNTIYLQT
jgi:hypothetical protein